VLYGRGEQGVVVEGSVSIELELCRAVCDGRKQKELPHWSSFYTFQALSELATRPTTAARRGRAQLQLQQKLQLHCSAVYPGLASLCSRVCRRSRRGSMVSRTSLRHRCTFTVYATFLRIHRLRCFVILVVIYLGIGGAGGWLALAHSEKPFRRLS